MASAMSKVNEIITRFIVNNSNSGKRFEARFGFQMTDKEALRDWTR